MGLYTTAVIGPLLPLLSLILGAGREDGLFSGLSMLVAVIVGTSLSRTILGTCGGSD